MFPTPEKCTQISTDRLQRWAKFIGAKEGTPIILLGVRHGRHSGEPILCTMEDMPDDLVCEFLRRMADAIEGKQGITVPFSMR